MSTADTDEPMSQPRHWQRLELYDASEGSEDTQPAENIPSPVNSPKSDRSHVSLVVARGRASRKRGLELVAQEAKAQEEGKSRASTTDAAAKVAQNEAPVAKKSRVAAAAAASSSTTATAVSVAAAEERKQPPPKKQSRRRSQRNTLALAVVAVDGNSSSSASSSSAAAMPHRTGGDATTATTTTASPTPTRAELKKLGWGTVKERYPLLEVLDLQMLRSSQDKGCDICHEKNNKFQVTTLEAAWSPEPTIRYCTNKSHCVDSAQASIAAFLAHHRLLLFAPKHPLVWSGKRSEPRTWTVMRTQSKTLEHDWRVINLALLTPTEDIDRAKPYIFGIRLVRDGLVKNVPVTEFTQHNKARLRELATQMTLNKWLPDMPEHYPHEFVDLFTQYCSDWYRALIGADGGASSSAAAAPAASSRKHTS